MARVKRVRSSATKQIILDACNKELNERGYFDTSIEAIANRAGLSKMAVYYHYESKETLCVEALKTVLKRLISELREELEGIEDPMRALEHAVDVIWGHFNVVGRSFYTMLGELRWINAELLSEIEREISTYSKVLYEIIAEGQKRGQIIADNPTVLTQLFIGTIASTIQWYDPKGSLPPDGFLALLRSVVPRIIARPADSAVGGA